MSEHYDVVIAGAGPAGAQCARDLAQREYDVLVLEAEPEEGFPKQSNKSTAGTFASMTGAFGIPDDVVMNYTDEVILESPNEHFVQKQPGAVLEFADFKRWLVTEGRDYGAEYRFGARVNNPLTEDGEVVGVQYDGDKEAFADIVVDATGPAAPLAKKLDVCNLERKNQAVGIEWELEGVAVDHPEFADLTDAMMLRLDHEYAPGGYSWVFHTGGDTAKVGVCYIQSESYQQYGDTSKSIDGHLNHWLETDPRFANAQQITDKQQHRGSAHIQMPDSLSTDSFMAIGDTVPTIDPLWGEGIHKCMESARVAAITADRCLMGSETDTSADEMAIYDDLWHARVAPDMRTRLTMTQLLYLAPNERYDRLMNDLNAMDIESLSEANDGSIRSLAKLTHVDDVPLLARFAKQRLAG